MANVNQSIKIKPVPYSIDGYPYPNIVSGESFDSSDKFMILSSTSIPKNSKVYMELTIIKNSNIKDLKYIPLYLGVHKDPYYGILKNDYVLLSCFYTKTDDFHAIEKKSDTRVIKTTISKIYTKIPIVNSTIGLSIDMSEELISIYTDGRLLLEYKTKMVDLNDEDPWYFSIYCNRASNIVGRINYGRYKTNYLPTDYKTLYQLMKEVTETTEEEVVENNGFIEEFIYCNMDIEEGEDIYEIEPHTQKRYLYVVFPEDKEELMYYGGNQQFQMYAGRSDIAYINLPCPSDPVPSIYIELIAHSAYLKNNYIGIPMEVGLAVMPKDEQGNDTFDYNVKSFRVCLYHKKDEPYKAYSILNGEEEEFEVPSPLNASSPTQPNTIGIMFDRNNSIISIITDGSIFSSIPIETIEPEDDNVYIFFKSADNVYIGNMYCLLHLGDDYIDYSIPESAMTIYDYWNIFLRKYLTYPRIELDSRLYVIRNDKFINRNIYSTLVVPGDRLSYNNFDAGLNTLFKTFNTISDSEDHENEPDIKYDDLLNNIKSDGRNT